MQAVIRIVTIEITSFRERLGASAQRIIRSNILRAVAGPLTAIFLNAFVWRATGSLMSVTIYNLLQWIGLPFAFFLNSYLLRRIHIRKAFALGAVLSGLSAACTVLFGIAFPNLIPLWGFLWGIGNGFYWANRNYLELQETVPEGRPYFYGLVYSVSSLANIIVPLIAGWFIIFGNYLGLYSPVHAYWLLFGISFIFIFLCARVILRGSFASPVPQTVRVPFFSSFLTKRRLLQISSGLFDGIQYMGVVLVLYLAGSEGILGTVTALAALSSVVALYLYGKFAKEKNLKGTLLASGLAYLFSAALLVLAPHQFGIIFYIVCVEVALSFSAMVASTLYCSLTESEMGERTDSRYSYIFDNELFLNIGRIIGVGIIICLAVFGSQKIGLFYGPLVVSALHVIFLLIFFYKARTQIHV